MHMAKQISDIEKQTLSEQEERAEALSKILDMTADNYDGIMTLLEIIEELQETGVLDMLKGFLRTRDKVGALAVEQLNQPMMHRVIKNGTNAFQFLGGIDPAQLQTIMNGISQGMDNSAVRMTSDDQTIGLWGMMKKMRDPDVSASMKTILGFMEGMGQEFNNKKTVQ